MAEIWGAAIAVVGAAGGAAMQANAAKKAAGTAAAGTNASIAEQQAEFNTTRMDTAPYRAIGTQALNALGSIYGYAPAATPQSFEQWSQANPDASILPPAPKQSFLQKHLGHALNPLSAFQEAGLVGGKGGAAPTGYDQAQARYQDYLRNFNAVPQYGGSAPKTAPGVGVGTNAMAPGYMPTAGGGVQQLAQVGPDASGQGGGVQPGAGGATAAGPPMPAGPDYSNFFASPDYQFRRQQGDQGIERSAAARGLTKSGNALTALADYNSNLAAGEFGNYFNRQATLAGIGQASVNTATQAGMNMANNNSQALVAGANARASGIADASNAWGNALGTIGGIAYDRWGRKVSTTSPTGQPS